MRIFIALFFSLLSLSSVGQTVVIDSKSYRPIIGWNIYDGAGFKTNLNIPKIIPTTGRDSGAIRYSITDSSLYVWTGYQWRQIGAGGGGGSQSLDDVLTIGNFSTNSVRARFQVRNSGNTTTLGDWFNNGNTTSELYIYNTNGRQLLLTYNNLEFKGTGSNYQSIRPHASPSAAYTTFNLPNTGAVQRYFPMTFKLNGTTVAAGDTGLVDLGTIATGIPTDSSVSISNRINLKLNISDTSSMLANYVRQQRFLDSLSAHTTKIDGKLSNITGLVTQGWNTKLTGSGTGGSPYVISVDTTTQTLTDGATITFNANSGVSARVVITANRALAFSNFHNGMFLSLAVIQDGTGGHTLTLPASTKVINGGAGAITLTTAANSHDILTFWKINDVIYCNYGKNYN